MLWLLLVGCFYQFALDLMSQHWLTLFFVCFGFAILLSRVCSVKQIYSGENLSISHVALLENHYSVGITHMWSSLVSASQGTSGFL